MSDAILGTPIAAASIMLLEKCVSKEVTTCENCDKGLAAITDRRGITFPILREFEHRNVIYNSAPTYMADLENELARANITNRHFIFSTESERDVDSIINAYKNHVSAKENQGFEALKTAIVNIFRKDFLFCDLYVPYTKTTQYEKIKKYVSERKIEYFDEGKNVSATIPSRYAQLFTPFIKQR